MAKFERMMQTERRLQALTGLNQATFDAFLPHFTQALDQYLAHTTLDGYQREGDRAITYSNSPLPTPTDRLLFILSYLKLNPIQEAHGQLFDMSQSNVSKWVRLLLDILTSALDTQGVLPARTPEELAAYLQTVQAPAEGSNSPLFGTMEPNDRSLDRSMMTSNRSTTAANAKIIPSKT